MKHITLKNKSQMKTKNLLIVAVIIFSGILNLNGAYAQEATTTPPTETDNVTLNIKLNQIQTITVNAGQKEVDIEYISRDDYYEGVSITKDDHLRVFSTGGFQVKVNSGEFLTNGVDNINSSDVTVLATTGSTNGGYNSVVNAVALGDEQTLITSETGGRDLNYNVTYSTKPATKDKYLNLYDKNATSNVFTTEVTYTIAAN